MAVSSRAARAIPDSTILALALALALGLRVAAALAVTWYVGRLGKPCVFADTGIYRELARTIVAGEPYQVSQWGVPHFALRTPGYPAFLAACRAAFGPGLLAVRLVQAVLGTVGVWMVGRLAGATVGGDDGPGRAVPRRAMALAAVEPYSVGMSALVLSEALFVPLMLAGLWALAALWGGKATRPIALAVGAGLASGAAILARPSWALFVPAALASWAIAGGPGGRKRIVGLALVVALATAATLAPWWARNGRIFGRFVPTALWVGASLYDGISPGATGASAMEFVDAPDVRSLGESEQDAVFRDRALAFAADHPGRVLELAAIKFGRFWSPWPNDGAFRSVPVALGSALVTVPIFGLVALGVWDRRRDARALVLLAAPLAYFCLLHLVFVSSIRYRIPGMVPGLALAALALGRPSTPRPDPALAPQQPRGAREP